MMGRMVDLYKYGVDNVVRQEVLVENDQEQSDRGGLIAGIMLS